MTLFAPVFFPTAAETPMEKLNKSRRVYWPKTPWYDVIECSRILGICPTVPDFANNGVVPKSGARQKKTTSGPQAGDKLVYRNVLARGFGRPGGMSAHQHSGDVVA